MEDNVVNRLVRRLEKINIKVELFGNYPWIYLNKVNGHKVKETFRGEHGFTIAFHPIRQGQVMTLTDVTKIFNIIRKYR